MKKEHKLARLHGTRSFALVATLSLLVAAGMAPGKSQGEQPEANQAETNQTEIIQAETNKESDTSEAGGATQLESASATRQERTTPVSSEPPSAAWKVTIEPEFGQALANPRTSTAGVQQTEDESQQAMSSSDEGLVEEPLPGGGYGVDLQGRFRSTTYATVAADGSTEVSHSAPTDHETSAPGTNTAPAPSDAAPHEPHEPHEEGAQ